MLDEQIENAFNEYINAGTYSNAIEKSGMTASALALEATQNADYEGAISWYLKAGDYPGAQEAIEFIGEYYMMTNQYVLAQGAFIKSSALEKSKDKLIEIGKIFYETKEYERALQCFEASGYKGEEYLASISLREEMLKPYKTVGNLITFGSYTQSSSNAKSSPIEWIVLEVQGNHVLLISRYGLDAKPYNRSYTSVTWEKCTLRNWLNNDFLNTAFTTEEQGAILLTNVDNSKTQCYSKWTTDGGNNTQDKIYLLSFAEANKFFGVTDDNSNMESQVVPTDYAIQNVATEYIPDLTKKGVAWWLRSPGDYPRHAACINCDGSLDFGNVFYSHICVRPALWINLENAGFLKNKDKQENLEDVISKTIAETSQSSKRPMVSWFRIKLDEDDNPQLWISMADRSGLHSATILRTYQDNNQLDHEEVVETMDLGFASEALRYRILNQVGAYRVIVMNSNGEQYSSDIMVWIEDIDGNGIPDTMIDASSGDVTFLSFENSFVGKRVNIIDNAEQKERHEEIEKCDIYLEANSILRQKQQMLSWFRTTLGEGSNPQLWLSMADRSGLNSVTIVRTYQDSNQLDQEEVIAEMSLGDVYEAICYLTLFHAGEYRILITNTIGEQYFSDVILLIEDVDGDGAPDTMTDADGTTTYLP